MAKPGDFPACGKVVESRDGVVVFSPQGTNYRLHLAIGAPWAGELPARVEGLVQATGRKVWTVPSGGAFLVPIVGTPRIVQGRVRYLDERQMVVHAGTEVLVDLPEGEDAYDLASGPLAVGAMVNVTLLPGAKFEALDSSRNKS